MYQNLWSDDVWFLRYGVWQMQLLFLILGYYFYPSISPKVKILKKWKKMHGHIIILHRCTKNYDQMMYSSWDMVKKWHIEVGAPPNNKFNNIKIIKQMYYQTKNFDVNFHCLKHTKKRNTLCSNYWVLHHILIKNQRLNKQLI